MSNFEVQKNLKWKDVNNFFLGGGVLVKSKGALVVPGKLGPWSSVWESLDKQTKAHCLSTSIKL